MPPAEEAWSLNHMTTGEVPPAVPLKQSVSLPGSKQCGQVLLKEAGQLLCAGRMRIQEDNSSAATASVRAVAWREAERSRRP